MVLVSFLISLDKTVCCLLHVSVLADHLFWMPRCSPWDIVNRKVDRGGSIYIHGSRVELFVSCVQLQILACKP